MSEPVSVGEWIRTFAAALSPAMVVLGWWWVNRQNNERESRKELRQLVDRALKTVNEAVEAAMRYHSASDRTAADARESWKLLLAINHIKNQLNLLGQNGIDFEPCIKPFIRLKQAATGDDFMTIGYRSWDTNDMRWMNVINEASALTHNLDLLFFNTFRK